MYKTGDLFVQDGGKQACYFKEAPESNLKLKNQNNEPKKKNMLTMKNKGGASALLPTY